MTTNLEILREKYDLSTTGGEVVLVFMPRYALEAIKGTYHRLRYELDKITDADIRDQIEGWLDAGQFGLEDEMLVQDLLDRMDTANGHLGAMVTAQQDIYDILFQSLYSGGGDIHLTDAVLSLGSGGGSWDDVEIGDLITAVEVIGAAL